MVGLALSLTPDVATAGSVRPPKARLAAASVDLGTATAFSVLGGQTVTNTGPTVISSNLGVSPGSAVTGFPPGTVLGTVHAGDAAAGTAQADLTTAYNDAAARTPDANVAGDIGGLTLSPGVYHSSSTLGVTGTLTLDAGGDPDAVFIFQVDSALTTAMASSISLTNGARACNVFWQVGSSATLGVASTFQGSILALTSITVNTGAGLFGRALARNGSVTLASNTITTADCEPIPLLSLPGAAAAGGLVMIGFAARRRRTRRRTVSGGGWSP